MRVVGISDMCVSRDPSDTLITYSLGSCVGLSLYDPEATTGGLIHCLLPLSKMDVEKAKARPQMFVDTGIVVLIEALLRLGAQKRNLVARVAGGSKLLDTKSTFDIGDRNFAVLRKILWKNDILITAKDVGGSIARTMTLEIETGITRIKSQGQNSILQ